MKKRFRLRGFVSLLNAFVFLVSLISGIVLYFTPQGKIANWTNWTFWGLNKHTWGAVHINSSIVFFVTAIMHIYYNRRAITGYIYSRFKKSMNLKLELALALVITLFMVWASIGQLQPFAAIIEWNEQIKVYWAGHAQEQPPIPHAEELTIAEYAQELGMTVQEVTAKFDQHNLNYDNNELIADIAEKNGMSPADIHNLVVGNQGKGRRRGGRQIQDPAGTGREVKSEQAQQGRESGIYHNESEEEDLGQSRVYNWGRMTVAQACKAENVALNEALKRLDARGIKASGDDNLKALASEYNMRPGQVAGIIRGTGVEH